MKYLILILSILFCVNFYVRAEEKATDKEAATVGTGDLSQVANGVNSQKIETKPVNKVAEGDSYSKNLTGGKLSKPSGRVDERCKDGQGRCLPTVQARLGKNTKPPKAAKAAAPAANSPAVAEPQKAE